MFSASLPPASVTRRLDRPWVYSWYCTDASSEPVVGTSLSPSGNGSCRWPPGRGTGTSASSAADPSGGVVMFALSMWLRSGIPLVGVRAVQGVEHHRVAVAGLEVAGLRGEADRGLGEVVVEVAVEVEAVGRDLLTVGLPRALGRRVPGAEPGLAQRVGALAELRQLELGTVLVARHPGLLGVLHDVVVVDVGERDHRVAVEERGALLEPAALDEVDDLGLAALLGAGVVVVDLGVTGVVPG